MNTKLESNNSDKFRSKYRISQQRLKGYDYSQSGMYYVTICTKNREHYFGKIVNEEMQLSELGNIANECWLKIPEHISFVQILGTVVMPDHVHGILLFDMCEYPAETNRSFEASVHAQGDNKFGAQTNNLASVIRGFKIGVTKYARRIKGISDVWQPLYHDRVLRNENEFNRALEYIKDNPMNWEKDDDVLIF